MANIDDIFLNIIRYWVQIMSHTLDQLISR